MTDTHLEHDLPVHGEAWLSAGLDRIAELRGEDAESDLLTRDWGADPFSNDVFTLQAYCWGDETIPGHRDGCPPNFTYRDIAITWYKHANRELRINRPVALQHWLNVQADCLESLKQRVAAAA